MAWFVSRQLQCRIVYVCVYKVCELEGTDLGCCYSAGYSPAHFGHLGHPHHTYVYCYKTDVVSDELPGQPAYIASND